jgi:ADP-ribosylation factor-like protein 2
VQPCSAYTGDKLVDGLDWLVRDVADRVYYSSPAIPVEEKEKDVVAAKINTAGNLTA